jgi:carbonic anhydrase/acetyltransferase-like protein (isoleucine patch superfamily)
MPLYELDGTSPALPEDGSSWIAPTADVIGDARLGKNVSIWFGAVIRSDNSPITIGDRTNIQDGSMLHSDVGVPLTIGTDCTVGHRVILHGCTIGNNVLVGMGTTILNHAVIGDNCLIGANALITEGKVFPAGSMIIGSPAKAVRELDEKTIERLKGSSKVYVDNAARFSAGLRQVD